MNKVVKLLHHQLISRIFLNNFSNIPREVGTNSLKKSYFDLEIEITRVIKNDPAAGANTRLVNLVSIALFFE